MKLLVLYEELAGYFIACINTFSESYDCDVMIVRKEANAVAPFQFKLSERVKLYDRNKLSGQELEKLVSEFAPDAVFCGGWAFKPYLEICKKYRKTIPVVLGFDNWWNGSLKQQVSAAFGKSYFSKRFNRCFVPGKPQKEFALKLGFPETAIATGAYCCDFKLFDSYFQKYQNEKKNTFPHRFIFAGRYVPEKGVDILWKAFGELQAENQSDWELWCLGKGELKPAEHPEIKHFGFVQPEALEEYIHQAGVFILPSLFEPWGVAAHEFAASGFPLLLSDKVGAAEAFLQDGKNGFVLKHGDKESLKNAMRTIMGMSDGKLFEMSVQSHLLATSITPEKWSASLYSLIR